MRLLFIPLFTLILFSLTSTQACQSESENNAPIPQPLDTTCLSEYANTGFTENKEGTISIIDTEILIQFNQEPGRILPCNMPLGFNNGDQVLFSGNFKSFPAGLRPSGQPFTLTKIELL